MRHRRMRGWCAGCGSRRRAHGAWHRSAPARSCSPRPACSTGGVRSRTGARRIRGTLSECARRIRPDLHPRRCVVDVGRRDGRHRSRARAGRGGSRARDRPRRRARTRRVPEASGRAGPVQHDAVDAAHRRPVRRTARMDGRAPGGRPVGARAGRARAHERAQLRAPLPRRNRPHARASVEQIRVEAAQRLLGETAWPVKRIAARCGFGSEETLRRCFVRVLGVSPQGYRERFVR